VAECAQAWEEVLELRAATAEEEDAAVAAPATPSPPAFSAGQARGVPDPLRGVSPWQVPGTAGAPSGSLREVGRLERLTRVSGIEAQSLTADDAKEAARARVPAVQRALEASVKEAVEACQTGTPADCAVAWDEVEELSATVNKAERLGEQQG
jgi:hypothetical protein